APSFRSRMGRVCAAHSSHRHGGGMNPLPLTDEKRQIARFKRCPKSAWQTIETANGVARGPSQEEPSVLCIQIPNGPRKWDPSTGGELHFRRNRTRRRWSRQELPVTFATPSLRRWLRLMRVPSTREPRTLSHTSQPAYSGPSRSPT